MDYTNYSNLLPNSSFTSKNTTRFSKATNLSSFDHYMPVVDPLGPYLFYPAQCQASSEWIRIGRKYRSPLIAYVRQGNQIEQDIIAQLEAIFTVQRSISAVANKTKNANKIKSINEFIPRFNET